jgi:hypothetical protein
MSPVHVLQMSPVHVLQMSPVHVLQMSPVHVLQMSPVHVLQIVLFWVLSMFYKWVQSRFYKSGPVQVLQHADSVSTIYYLLSKALESRVLYHLYKQIFFSYMEKLCCFFEIGSSFLRDFKKMQQIILWLWCMNWNKRVRSERMKSHFRGPRFQNFPGEDTPDPPTNARSWASVSLGTGSVPALTFSNICKDINSTSIRI